MEKKIQEYKERYRFWSDKRTSQLSFHNDFMLTLGVGVIAYLWSERNKVYTNLIFDINAQIDWMIVIFLLGVISIALSILSGFLLSLSRLYDLRITSNILLTRKRAAQHNIKLVDEKRSMPKYYESIINLFCVIQRYQNYEIHEEDIPNNNELQSKFTELRQISRNLGYATWGLLKWQTVFLFVGIIISMFVLAVK